MAEAPRRRRGRPRSEEPDGAKATQIRRACEAHDWPVDSALGLLTSLPSVPGHKTWSQDWWARAVLKNQPSQVDAYAKVKAEKDWLDGELRTLVTEALSLKQQSARVKKGPSPPPKRKRKHEQPSTGARRTCPRTKRQRAADAVLRRAGWSGSLASANEATVAETDAIVACTDLPKKLVSSAGERARFFWDPKVDRDAIMASLFEQDCDGNVSVPLFHGTSCESARCIAADGFSLEFQNEAMMRWAGGAYASVRLDTAIQYSKPYNQFHGESDGRIRSVLVFRVRLESLEEVAEEKRDAPGYLGEEQAAAFFADQGKGRTRKWAVKKAGVGLREAWEEAGIVLTVDDTSKGVGGGGAHVVVRNMERLDLMGVLVFAKAVTLQEAASLQKAMEPRVGSFLKRVRLLYSPGGVPEEQRVVGLQAAHQKKSEDRRRVAADAAAHYDAQRSTAQPRRAPPPRFADMKTPDFAVGHRVHEYETPLPPSRKIKFFCLGDAVGGCGNAKCPHRKSARPSWPFLRKELLDDHTHHEKYPCPGDKPGGCGNADCPRRSGVKPYRPFNSEAQLKAHVESERAKREKAAARPPLEPGSSRVWAEFPDDPNGPSSWWGGTVVVVRRQLYHNDRNLSVVFDDGTLVDVAERYVQRDPPACELDVKEPNEAARALLRDQGITVVPVAPVAGGRSRRANAAP